MDKLPPKETLLPKTERLPRKEDLLPKQSPPKTGQEQPNTNTNPVQQARDAAEIAEQRAKQVKFETDVKLQEHGYKSLEDGLNDAKKRILEAERVLEQAHKQEQTINVELENIATEKQKVTNAYAIVKAKEEEILARLEQATQLEQKHNKYIAKQESLINEMQDIISYHNKNVSPCVRAIRLAIQSLYNIWVVLENPEDYNKEEMSDFVLNGLNSAGRQTNIVDNYLKVVLEDLQAKIKEQ